MSGTFEVLKNLQIASDGWENQVVLSINGRDIPRVIGNLVEGRELFLIHPM